MLTFIWKINENQYIFVKKILINKELFILFTHIQLYYKLYFKINQCNLYLCSIAIFFLNVLCLRQDKSASESMLIRVKVNLYIKYYIWNYIILFLCLSNVESSIALQRILIAKFYVLPSERCTTSCNCAVDVLKCNARVQARARRQNVRITYATWMTADS